VIVRAGLVALLALALGAPAARAQRGRLDTLAALLAAEDARGWDSLLFARAVASRDALVRRTAVMGAGRIGDRRATPLVAGRLRDPAPPVRAAAAFALGLLRDSTAAGALADALTAHPPLDSAGAAETATALGRIGGPRAEATLAKLLDRQLPTAGSRTASASAIAAALLEVWRLGKDAPVAALRRYAADSSAQFRWPAVFSLSRLRPPDAAPDLVAALDDGQPVTRAYAARALTRSYVERSGLTPADLAARLARATSDSDAVVRINALAALGTYRDSSLAPAALARLDDDVINVRVQAATTLGALGGGSATARLRLLAAGGAEAWAVRRSALLALAACDPLGFDAAAESWRASPDWRNRAAAAEGWVAAGRRQPASWLADGEARVIAAGLQAWADATTGPDAALVAAARPLLAHADAAVRSLAADALARVRDPADVSALARMYGSTGRDSFPNAALSALKALAAVAGASDSGRQLVDREFLDHAPRPADDQLRRWAESEWPAAASRWGPAFPIATGRTPDDYRAVVRRRVLGTAAERHPHVLFVTAGSEPVEVELLGPDAPLTVEHFLDLVDRRFFDGNRWHRVVPNFVVQDGDPRGDGWGGPPGTIRDEINPVRYGPPVLGMALDGPDSGNSQWFINLSPQPHLDGTYTVFGRVVLGADARGLGRIAQGDSILAIRRAR
jgi:cyclophilin family peptidyl-prolyl cis-trans isomerase/HEAT repeat protein